MGVYRGLLNTAALIYEHLEEYKNAIDMIKKAKKLGFTIPEGTVKRIEKKSRI